MTEKQNQVAGERREKDVTDFPRAAAIGQVLLGLQFPADKNKIIQPVQEQILSFQIPLVRLINYCIK
jgi:hypothetical protein